MAGSSVTFTETVEGRMHKIKASWVSDDSAGTASGTTSIKANGKVELLTTVPSGGGTAPTDNYDIALNDGDGVDVLGGGGANRDTANTEQVLGTSLGAVVSSVLTLAITNAGNSKQGTVYIVIKS